jgi:hypothetical protein
MQLKKSLDLLKETEEMWNTPLDLKLHDVYMMHECEKEVDGEKVTISVENEKYQGLFYDFCNDLYNDFLEWSYENLEVFSDFCNMADYIGRTSKFYLSKMHNDYKDKYATALYEIAGNSALYEIAGDFLENVELKEVGDTFQVDLEKSMEFYENDEDLAIDLVYIVEGLADHVKAVLDDVKAVYDYIEDIKDGQCELFTDYVLQWVDLD